MTAELKEMYSLEIDTSMNNYYPTNSKHFEIDLCLVIGILNQEGGDLFYITVSSIDFLKERCLLEKEILSRGLMIVHEYDYISIKNRIEKYIQTCSGDNWNEIANKISKMCYWEFDNYYLVDRI